MIFSKTFSAFKMPARKESFPVPHNLWHDTILFLAFGLGSGAIPIAPGTFGTIMAIPFYLMIQTLPIPYYLLFVGCFTILSIAVCQYASDLLRVHDHPGICIDEFAGFFVTMIAAPHGWYWVVIGFILFRIFDIIKPWPIRFLDRMMRGGFGIVIDDIVAGLFGCIVLQLLVFLTVGLQKIR